MIAHTCTWNGKSIRYYTEGEGPALVFLHGFLESSFIWKSFSSQLAQRYKVVCIDLPGHGETSVFGDKHSMPLMADVVAAVVKQEQLRQVVVFGHSMGGYTSLAFAERYSEYCGGIGLLNSTAFPDTEEKKADRLRAVRVLELNPNVFIREAIPNLFAPFNLERLSAEVEIVRSEALKTPVEGAVACLKGMREREDKTGLLKSGKFPVLFIAGSYDNIIPAGLSLEQIELHRSVKGLLLEKCGHMCFMEQPEETLSAIKEFCQAIFQVP